MKRVAEIMHIPDPEREAFLKGALNPSEEDCKVLWLCGVRNQQYFASNDLIFMTFEYEGDDFAMDMNRMSAYLDSKGLLVKTRRKDVAPELRGTTSWWAPVKRLASLFETKPACVVDDWDTEALEMYSNPGHVVNYDTSYSDDDWTESVYF